MTSARSAPLRRGDVSPRAPVTSAGPQRVRPSASESTMSTSPLIRGASSASNASSEIGPCRGCWNQSETPRAWSTPCPDPVARPSPHRSDGSTKMPTARTFAPFASIRTPRLPRQPRHGTPPRIPPGSTSCSHGVPSRLGRQRDDAFSDTSLPTSSSSEPVESPAASSPAPTCSEVSRATSSSERPTTPPRPSWRVATSLANRPMDMAPHARQAPAGRLSKGNGPRSNRTTQRSCSARNTLQSSASLLHSSPTSLLPPFRRSSPTQCGTR